MATTAITVKKLAQNTFTLDAITMTAASVAADGFLVDISGVADQKLLLIFQNTGATNRIATIKAGNALQGVEDLVSGNIAASKFGAVTVESGKFINVSGVNKGKILVIPAHAELQMAAIALP